MDARHILVVDDNEFVGDALNEVLIYLGYLVLRARGPKEGLALFRQHGARAVITDNAMYGDPLTDMSGLEVAARIKEASPSTPVIMLSALPPDEAANVCDLVLSKPVPMRELARALLQLGVAPLGSP